MPTLSAWRFDSAEGAEDALAALRALCAQDLVRVRDAAVVRWPSSRSRPQARHLADLAGDGAPGPVFWDLFVALIFLAPLLGGRSEGDAAAGPEPLGAVGIGDAFVLPLREGVRPGTSALLVMTADASAQRELTELLRTDRAPLRADISREQETVLRRAFADA